MSKVEPRRRQPEVMPMSNIKQNTKKLRSGPYNKGNSVWVYITISDDNRRVADQTNRRVYIKVTQAGLPSSSPTFNGAKSNPSDTRTITDMTFSVKNSILLNSANFETV